MLGNKRKNGDIRCELDVNPAGVSSVFPLTQEDVERSPAMVTCIIFNWGTYGVCGNRLTLRPRADNYHRS